MKGMLFVHAIMQTVGKGQPPQIAVVSQGQIIDKVGDSQYLVSFEMGNRSHSRVVDTSEIAEARWNLFETPDEYKTFMLEISKPPADAVAPPSKKPVTKKKVTRGKSKIADTKPNNAS